MHRGGDVPPDPELGEIGIDQGPDGQKAHDGQRFNVMAHAKTGDVSRNTSKIDHDIPQVLFLFCDDSFLHASRETAREMSLRADMTWVKSEDLVSIRTLF